VRWVRVEFRFDFGSPNAYPGEPVTPAVALGLANKALPAEQVLPAAREVARMLATRPLGSLIATKKLMPDRARTLDQTDCEDAIFATRLKTAEAAEAFRAFAERRQPDFNKVAH